MKQKTSPWIVALAIVLLAIIGVTLLATIAYALFPFVASRSVSLSAKKASTRSNMMHIALSIAMYAADYDGCVPPLDDPVRMKKALSRYVGDYGDAWFTTLNPNGGEIRGNENLSFACLDGVQDPSALVLLYETENWPDDGRFYGFADSRVFFRNDTSSFVWKLKVSGNSINGTYDPAK